MPSVKFWKLPPKPGECLLIYSQEVLFWKFAKITCDIQIRFLPQKSCFCCNTGVSCTIQIWTVSGILSPELYVQQIFSAEFLIKSLHETQVLLLGLFWFHCLLTKELQNKCQDVKVSPGKLRQRAACFPAGRHCLMSHSPSDSPAHIVYIKQLISAVLKFVCQKPCPKLCLVLHGWCEVQIAWVRTEALADLENRLCEEDKPQVGRDGTNHVCFLKSLLSTAGEAGMASSTSKTTPAEFEQ